MPEQLHHNLRIEFDFLLSILENAAEGQSRWAHVFEQLAVVTEALYPHVTAREPEITKDWEGFMDKTKDMTRNYEWLDA